MQLLIFTNICAPRKSSNLLNVYWPYACFAIVCSTFSHLVFPLTTVRFLSAGRYSPKLPFRVVGSNGLGPSTSRLSGVCSNQLSYEPIMVEVIGFEPMTPCLQGRCSTSWAIPPFLRSRKINAPLFQEKQLLLKTNKKETIEFPID